MNTYPYGFIVRGDARTPRRIVDAVVAFDAFAVCDPRAKVDKESYLSLFNFGPDFRARADPSDVVDTKGYDGPCWAAFVWWDVDQPELSLALTDARRLATGLLDLCQEDELLIFLSGSKGFHLGVPTSLFAPEPSLDFHRIARRFCETQAERAEVTIDSSIYSKIRLFRSPNSRHPRTGLHKRRLMYDELMGLNLDAIRTLAQKPEPFDVPTGPSLPSPPALAAWAAAQTGARAADRAGTGQRRSEQVAVYRATRELITDPASVEVGSRHRRIYSAAANLAELSCPLSAVLALLTEPGRDTGLPPSDVDRAIRNGWERGAKSNE